MAVPKRRHTPGRTRKRRSHHGVHLEDKIHGVKHRYKRYYDRQQASQTPDPSSAKTQSES